MEQIKYTFNIANMLEKLVFVIIKNSTPFIFCTPVWSYFKRKYIRPKSIAINLNRII